MKDKKQTTQDSPQKKGKITPSWPIIYGLVEPSGKYRGVFRTECEAWVDAFDFQSDEFRLTRYWTLAAHSRRALRRLGWRVVKGRFVEEGGGK